jgi:uridine kinase
MAAKVIPLQGLDRLTGDIVALHHKSPRRRALLVGISGIDGSGKSFAAAQLGESLHEAGCEVAAISVDDWLNLPPVCVDRDDPAEHFYEHAIRFPEMFQLLIDPLVRDRGVDLVADIGDARATVYRKHRYLFNDIDIVLLEGIFLFKLPHRSRFDLKIWIDCSFETAQQRAVARAQEGLAPAETIRAFNTIYFPAQRLHFERDRPRAAADYVLANDPVQSIL